MGLLRMEFDIIIGIASIVIIAIAFVMMLIAYKKLTKGHWKRYVFWLVVSGGLMSLYLLSYLIAKMDIYQGYYSQILLIGFVAETFAALTYIRSSHVLNNMGNEFGLARHSFFKNLNNKEEK